MSRFFVGQRVRILFSIEWPELKGEEGRIVGVEDRPTLSGKRCDWQVAPDVWGSHDAPRRSINGATCFSPRSEQLEPIQPEGHRACDDEFKRDLDKLLEGLPA